ncbi:hypothetical protein O6H91_Y055500 [Diphasiastrum complanatum]|nr:hypothetical protein O6H91_Y055500 [Diphasiastrum complanatum]
MKEQHGSLFNYRPDIHNVLLVTRSDYRACSSPNPVATFDNGKTTMSLTSVGSKYYMCGVAGHCGLGQKLAIMVLPAESGSPVPSPMSGGPTGSLLAPGISPSPSKGPAAAPSNSGTSIGCALFFNLMIGVVGAILNSSLQL